jgi:hypothetical protein
MLSWAVAVHGLQMAIINRTVVDLGNENFAKVQVCAASSRVESLGSSAISDLAPNEIFNKPSDESALAATSFHGETFRHKEMKLVNNNISFAVTIVKNGKVRNLQVISTRRIRLRHNSLIKYKIINKHT